MRDPLLSFLGALCFTVTAWVFFRLGATEERLSNVILGLAWLACAAVQVFRARWR